MKRVVASSIIMKHLYLPKVLWLTSQPWYQVFCSGWVRPQSRVDSCISSSRVQLLNVADACRWDRGEGGMNELSKWFRIGWTVSFASWTFSSFPPPREKHYYNTYCHKFLKKNEKFSLSHLTACLDRNCCAEVGMSLSANRFVLDSICCIHGCRNWIKTSRHHLCLRW